MNRNKLKKLFARLPKPLRFALMRRMINLPHTLPGNWGLRVLHTRDDIEASMQVVHQAYVASGLRPNHANPLRMTKYQLVPGSAILALTVDDEVVATLTLIPDGPLGLPVDMAWDLTPVRNKHQQVAAISSLAVRHDYRRQGGAVLLPLLQLMMIYNREVLGAEALVFDVSVKAQDYYEGLLLAQPVPYTAPKAQAFANGYLARPYYMTIADVRRRGTQVYGNKPTQRNLVSFFYEKDLGVDSLSFSSGATATTLFALADKADIWDTLTPQDWEHISAMYTAPSIRRAS